MGYQVKKILNKKTTSWRIIWRSYKNSMTRKDSITGKVTPKCRHVSIHEYQRLGILKSMTLQEVKDILTKINLEEIRNQREERRNVVALRLAKENEIECGHLPKAFTLKWRY